MKLIGFRHPAVAGDAGLLLRALELATAQHHVEFDFDVSAFSSASFVNLGTLAGLISQHTGCFARKVLLEPATLVRRCAIGSSALISRDGEWLVLHGRKATRVTPEGESSTRLTDKLLRRLGLDESTELILIDPPFGLDRLRQTGQDPGSDLFRFWRLGHLESHQLSVLVVYAAMIGVMSIAVPLSVQILVNSLTKSALLQPLILLSLGLLFVLTLHGLVHPARWYAAEVVERRIFVRVTEDFAHRLVRVCPSERKRQDLRELSNRFFEVVNLQKSSAYLLLDSLELALKTIFGLGLLAFYHPFLLAFDVALVLALVGVLWLGRPALATASAESKAKYKVAHWVQCLAQHHQNLYHPSGYAFATGRADALVRQYLHSRKRHFRHIGQQLIGGVIVQVLGMVALVGLGGYLVIVKQELTLGQLVSAELVVGVILAGSLKLGKHLEKFYDLVVGLDKIGSILDLEALPMPMAGPQNRMRVVYVHQLPVEGLAQPVSAVFYRGQQIWVKGARRQQRRDLLTVLGGGACPSGSKIRAIDVNNRPLPDAVRVECSAQLRNCRMRYGSILDHFRSMAPSIEERQVWTLLRKVGLADRIMRFDRGLDTQAFEVLASLSPSRLAALAVARLLLSEASVIVLDDTVQAFELEQKELVLLYKAVFERFHDRIVIVDTTHESIGELCSAIWDLDTGEQIA